VSAAGKSRNNGQVCVSRPLLRAQKHQQVLPRTLRGRTAKRRLGHARVPRPRSSPPRQQRRLDFIERCGGRQRTKGPRSSPAQSGLPTSTALFLQPTDFTTTVTSCGDERRPSGRSPPSPPSRISPSDRRGQQPDYGLAANVFTREPHSWRRRRERAQTASSRHKLRRRHGPRCRSRVKHSGSAGNGSQGLMTIGYQFIHPPHRLYVEKARKDVGV
jgi:hypothetical protein